MYSANFFLIFKKIQKLFLNNVLENITLIYLNCATNLE